MYQDHRIDNPEYSQDDLAEDTGYDPGYISKILGVAREGASNPDVWNAPTSTAALNIVERIKTRRAEVMDELVREVLNPGVPKAPDPILNADFNEWVKTYKGPKFNFVHCDFPYGIESNSFNQGSADIHGGYEDTPKTYWTLIESLCANRDRLCTENCHFMFWFSMHNYHSTLEYFQKHSDIVFDDFPLVWTKIDNTGIMPDYRRGPRRIYETALFGARGDPRIVKPVSNAFGWAADKSSHMSIKPEEVLKYFFQMFVDGTTLMLDPTAGSGTALRAAESLGAPYVVGLEVNKEWCEDANRAVRKARAEKEAAQ
jgi:DNA modification methylase